MTTTQYDHRFQFGNRQVHQVDTGRFLIPSLFIEDATPSTSTTTGSLVLQSGMGVQGESTFGGDVNALGDVNVAGPLESAWPDSVLNDFDSITLNGPATISGAGQAALSVNSTGRLLASEAAGAPEPTRTPVAQLARTTPFTVTAAAGYTAVPWSAQSVGGADEFFSWSSTANPERLQIQVTGRYSVQWQLTVSTVNGATAQDVWDTVVQVNNPLSTADTALAGYARLHIELPTGPRGAGEDVAWGRTVDITLTAGDYLTLFIQNEALGPSSEDLSPAVGLFNDTTSYLSLEYIHS